MRRMELGDQNSEVETIVKGQSVVSRAQGGHS